LETPALEDLSEWLASSKDRSVSTTMGFVSLLRHLLKDPKIGKFIVPIIPDEARTFGMEPIIRQVGIYANQGQQYEPYDKGGHAPLLPRGKRWPNARGGHYGSRLDSAAGSYPWVPMASVVVTIENPSGGTLR
jgi:hypothetical protein